MGLPFWGKPFDFLMQGSPFDDTEYLARLVLCSSKVCIFITQLISLLWALWRQLCRLTGQGSYVPKQA